MVGQAEEGELKRTNNIFFHLIAITVVMIWGSTFIFTKLLLLSGLSSAMIFTLRFTIAYAILLVYSLISTNLGIKRIFKRGKKSTGNGFRWFSKSLKDELVFLVLGISGGSLYFLAENSAMNYTTATNDALIVCSCPLFTTFLACLFFKSERINRRQLYGTLIALAGMAVVVLNGQFVVHVSPKGDMLAFVACLCWAVYSLIMIPMSKRYSSLFITRKVFFYGLVTMIPYFMIYPEPIPWSSLAKHEVLMHLLYLSLIASAMCFLTWTWVMKKLSVVVATNYVYLNPLATILFAWWLLGEPVTLWLLIGTGLLLFGLYELNRKK